jgi:hypothetical protein
VTLHAEPELPTVLGALNATPDDPSERRSGVGNLIGRWLDLLSPRRAR